MAKFDDGGEDKTRQPMRPGDVFTFNRKDKDGNSMGTLTIERTARPYAYDLCDAYNNSMRADARERGLKYFVDSMGNVKIGFPPEFSERLSREINQRNEDERKRFAQRTDGGRFA